MIAECINYNNNSSNSIEREQRVCEFFVVVLSFRMVAFSYGFFYINNNMPKIELCLLNNWSPSRFLLIYLNLILFRCAFLPFCLRRFCTVIFHFQKTTCTVFIVLNGMNHNAKFCFFFLFFCIANARPVWDRDGRLFYCKLTKFSENWNPFKKNMTTCNMIIQFAVENLVYFIIVVSATLRFITFKIKHDSNDVNLERMNHFCQTPSHTQISFNICMISFSKAVCGVWLKEHVKQNIYCCSHHGPPYLLHPQW